MLEYFVQASRSRWRKLTGSAQTANAPRLLKCKIGLNEKNELAYDQCKSKWLEVVSLLFVLD